MRKYFILSSLFFLLGYQSFYGQTFYTLSGRIKDSKSREDIIGAKVFIPNTSYGTVTNIYGIFMLKIPQGKYTVSVQAFGYSTISTEIDVSQDITKDFFLKEAEYEADEIIVSGERSDEQVKSTAVGKVELQLSQIKKLPSFLGETDVIRSLLFTPGVITATDLASGFNVRGGSIDQNLVLLDDAVIYNPIHFGGIFSAFNGDALKSATLYKSSFPIEYGGRLSSVLDIRQRDGNAERFSGSFAVGLLASRLLFEGPIGSNKTSFLVSLRRSYVDLVLKAVPDPLTQSIEIYFYDINLKVNHTFDDRNRLYMSFYNGRDHLFLPISTGSSDVSIGFDYGNTAFTLRWNHLFKNGLFGNLLLSYSNFFFSNATNIVSSTGTQFGITVGQRILNYTLRNDYVYNITDALTIKFGVEGIGYTYMPGNNNRISVSSPTTDTTFYTGLQNQNATEWSIYVGAEHDITPSLKIDYGLRLNTFWQIGEFTLTEYLDNKPVLYDSQTGIASFGKPTGERYYNPWEMISFYYGLEPRISARYLLFEETSIKASYQWLRQNSHLVSLTTIGLPFDNWYPSGPYIKPQTSHNFSLGIYQNFFDGEIEISAEGYFRLFDNLLDYTEGGNVLLNPTVENSLAQVQGRSYGFEVFVQKAKTSTGTFIDNLSATLSYSFSVSERRYNPEAQVGVSDDINRYYRAPYDKTHSITSTLVYEIDRWTFSAAFTYQTNIPVNISLGSFLGSGGQNSLDISSLDVYGYYGTDRNTFRLSDYHRLDLSVRYDTEFTIAGVKFDCGLILSTFNTYNRSNAIGTISTEAEGLQELSIVPILPNLSFEVSF